MHAVAVVPLPRRAVTTRSYFALQSLIVVCLASRIRIKSKFETRLKLRNGGTRGARVRADERKAGLGHVLPVKEEGSLQPVEKRYIARS